MRDTSPHSAEDCTASAAAGMTILPGRERRGFSFSPPPLTAKDLSYID
jgi:hypothetical protein